MCQHYAAATLEIIAGPLMFLHVQPKNEMDASKEVADATAGRLSILLCSVFLSSTVATRLVSSALSLSALIANRTNSDLTNRPLVGRRLGLLESQGYSQPPQDTSWDRALPRAGRPHCTEHS